MCVGPQLTGGGVAAGSLLLAHRSCLQLLIIIFGGPDLLGVSWCVLFELQDKDLISRHSYRIFSCVIVSTWLFLASFVRPRRGAAARGLDLHRFVVSLVSEQDDTQRTIKRTAVAPLPLASIMKPPPGTVLDVVVQITRL